MKPLQRGQIIEDRLANTVYKDWYHVGREMRGKFPLIDFQKGTRLVSVKSVNPSSPGAYARMKQHITELRAAKLRVDGQKATVELDIRVPRGADTSTLQRLRRVREAKDVEVSIHEF